MAEPIDVGQYAAVPAQVDAPSDLLAVHDLHVHFPAVDGLSFTLDRGQTLGIVGESGSGKSVTSLGILGLHHGTSARITGQVWLDGEELINAGTARVRALRGNKMAMIFQDPLSSLHPYYTVGNQIIEAYRIHNEVSKQAARKHAIEMLNRVGIPQAADRVDDYPHQFSGGMRQRVMIAMALSCDPELLIADEPTTALDVTIQAQIMELLASLQKRLGLVAEFCERVIVMYTGRIVEEAPVRDLFANPAHPYTRGLLKSLPSLAGD